MGNVCQMYDSISFFCLSQSDTKIQGDRQELQVVLEQPEVSDLVAMLECQAFALEDILD